MAFGVRTYSLPLKYTLTTVVEHRDSVLSYTISLWSFVLHWRQRGVLRGVWRGVAGRISAPLGSAHKLGRHVQMR